MTAVLYSQAAPKERMGSFINGWAGTASAVIYSEIDVRLYSIFVCIDSFTPALRTSEAGTLCAAEHFEKRRKVGILDSRTLTISSRRVTRDICLTQVWNEIPGIAISLERAWEEKAGTCWERISNKSAIFKMRKREDTHSRIGPTP
jgi:hypothetical protein